MEIDSAVARNSLRKQTHTQTHRLTDTHWMRRPISCSLPRCVTTIKFIRFFCFGSSFSRPHFLSFFFSPFSPCLPSRTRPSLYLFIFIIWRHSQVRILSSVSILRVPSSLVYMRKFCCEMDGASSRLREWIREFHSATTFVDGERNRF